MKTKLLTLALAGGLFATVGASAHHSFTATYDENKELSGQGVTRDSLKPGDHVVITGNPGRNPVDHRIRMRSLLRPSDGFGWGFEGESFD
jgi:hypothetical protein